MTRQYLTFEFSLCGSVSAIKFRKIKRDNRHRQYMLYPSPGLAQSKLSFAGCLSGGSAHARENGAMFLILRSAERTEGISAIDSFQRGEFEQCYDWKAK